MKGEMEEKRKAEQGGEKKAEHLRDKDDLM